MLWLSPQDAYADGDDLAGIAGKGDQFAQERHKGFICAQEASFDRATAPAELLNAIGTAVSRIGLAMPRTPCPVPAGGAIWVRPLLFRGLGPSVRPFEMTPDGGGGTFPGRETLLGMLGLLAREAGMGNAPPPTPAEPAKRDVKTVAFYLPQFHPIPENDRWWGRGFTEWNNVTRGKPLFRNHYQPRVPADLGYYDLRLEDVQVAQADLARDFGLHGFCYYYYWFNGKKLLNQPVEQMARSDRIDTGFCVCWANENWSRNWDGQNRHVLLKQEYSLESNVALIRELIPMMKDPRWIRFRGKPVMVVYRISIIPNWLETARLWREECRRAGLGEIHLCAVRFGLEPLQGPPEEHGLDSYVLFPPHEAAREDLRDKVLDLHRDFGGEVFDYSAVVDGDLQRFASGYDWPVHRGMMLGWDNTARRLTDARVFHGATPYGLRRWMQGVLEQDARHNPDPESLIFVNAWNEWAEGTYLEPDQRWGRASLEALRSAVEADPVARPVVVPEGTARRPRTDALMKRAGEPLRDEGKALRPMEWIPGKRRPAADAPTVMLCAHIAGHQLFGGERSFLDVLDALSQMPLNVIVTLPSGNNRSYVDEICERCVRAYVFAYPQWMDNRDPHGWLTLNFAEIIARHAVDVVHVNTIVILEPLLAARALGRTAVVHSRELISLDEPLRERMALSASEIVSSVLRNSDWVIGNSRATCKLFGRHGRTLYVPNAVTPADFDIGNRFGRTVKFGIVSSNLPKKGVADFVEVARLVAERTDLARFVVVGPENALTREWEAEVRAGTRPDNIVFAGYRDTPRLAMTEMNVLLNLSHFAESFGRTVAEALAARRPVIAYEWGALPELVQHGETGYLVSYRDVQGVADAVVRLVEAPQTIREMGEKGRAFVSSRFSQDSLRSALDESYRRILSRPMLSDDADATAADAPPLAAAITGHAPRTTVVVPVYNAPDEVRACLASVLRHTDLSTHRLLVIDDGSPDPAVAPMLEDFGACEGVTLLRNDPNIGYTKTINRGIRDAGTDDVVLLNSDTIVTPRWLEGLRAAAYSRARVGTVTAMSDNAGAFSFPEFNKPCPKPDHMSHDEYALAVLHETQSCAPVEVPTGSGFCMYIRRALVDACGVFDEEGFPRGYGEENDFCMRALQAGWSNLVSPWSFVYHVRTASFKGEKEKLVKAGVDVVTRRYPDYAKKVKAAFGSEAMKGLREAAQLATS